MNSLANAITAFVSGQGREEDRVRAMRAARQWPHHGWLHCGSWQNARQRKSRRPYRAVSEQELHSPCAPVAARGNTVSSLPPSPLVLHVRSVGASHPLAYFRVCRLSCRASVACARSRRCRISCSSVTAVDASGFVTGDDARWPARFACIASTMMRASIATARFASLRGYLALSYDTVHHRRIHIRHHRAYAFSGSGMPSRARAACGLPL